MVHWLLVTLRFSSSAHRANSFRKLIGRFISQTHRAIRFANSLGDSFRKLIIGRIHFANSRLWNNHGFARSKPARLIGQVTEWSWFTSMVTVHREIFFFTSQSRFAITVTSQSPSWSRSAITGSRSHGQSQLVAVSRSKSVTATASHSYSQR